MEPEYVDSMAMKAAREIESAIDNFRRAFPRYDLVEKRSSGFDVRYILKSDRTFVDYSWYVRDKFHIAIGPLDSDGKIPSRVLNAGKNQFNTHYSMDMLGLMDGAKNPYALAWRSDVLRATAALMVNAKPLLEGDWSGRTDLERSVRPGFMA